MKVVSTKLSNTEWEELIEYCNNTSCTIAEYVRKLILREQGKTESSKPNAPKKPISLEEMLRILSKKKC